jgi:plastocyanin domain-containing protein
MQGIAAEILARLFIQTSQFPRIEQPLSLKVSVTLGGIALIGLELWWFLLSRHCQVTTGEKSN